MTMNAYDSIYLDSAMENLGDAFDYAVNVCHISLSDFYSYFTACGLARQYGEGNPRFVMGFSGSELVQYAVENVGLRMDFPAWMRRLINRLNTGPAGFLLISSGKQGCLLKKLLHIFQ